MIIHYLLRKFGIADQSTLVRVGLDGEAIVESHLDWLLVREKKQEQARKETSLVEHLFVLGLMMFYRVEENWCKSIKLINGSPKLHSLKFFLEL